jgi:hypothetical protein
MTQFESCLQHFNINNLSINALNDELNVAPVAMYDNGMSYEGMEEWFGFETTEGIIAYFGCEMEANQYRIDYMKRIIQGVWDKSPVQERNPIKFQNLLATLHERQELLNKKS